MHIISAFAEELVRKLISPINSPGPRVATLLLWANTFTSPEIIRNRALTSAFSDMVFSLACQVLLNPILVKFLKSKDYIILDFYKIPIKKQLEVISTGAEFIIPSSSAMYNLCFARLDAKITILDHDIEDNSGKLFGPLEMIGFNIIYVFFPSNESQSNNKHSNYIIDINKLENIL